MPLPDSNVRALRGAQSLDARIIPDDFDWKRYDVAPEQHKVRPASEYEQAVIDEFYGEGDGQGAYWPWDKCTNKGMRFRPCEVSVFAGINGHRKSMLTSQIALHLMRQDEPVLVMSFEMRVVKTLSRMLRQSAGCAEPSLAYLKAWHRWSGGRLWCYDHLGTCGPRQTIAVARYATHELGVKHVLIDSLMKVVSAPDDYAEQKKFVGDLGALALAEKCHVHLVAHARKGKDERDGIGKWDVKGAGEITDQADNVLLVSKKIEPEEGQPDQWLEVAKQRDGAFEGTFGLYFNADALSFGESPGGRWPMIHVGDLS